MALRERERSGTETQLDTRAPRRADRLRRLLAVAAALAALIAFATLARPESSPSARLRIGTETSADEDAADAPERGRAARPARAGEGLEALVRPLDASTLADMPANILTLGPDEWISPSPGGALLAVRDFSAQGRNEIRVLDARTFQPVATVEVDGSLNGVLGFTPGADALVVEVGGAGPQSVQRHPLDSEQPVTGVELPEGVALASDAAALADGRVAMVVADRSDLEPEPAPSTRRVLVVDLLEERILVDLPLPGLQSGFIYGTLSQEASQALPGFAWDTARERLYVVHADAARVTVVDLIGGTVLAEAETGAPITELRDEPYHRWWWAEVSPDGTRLYTAGYEALHDSSTAENFGLSVIDTATLTEVGRVEDVDGPQLSPDGRWLLWSRNAVWTRSGITRRTPRVALMDTTQIGLVHLLGDRTAASPLGFSRDSSHVYLQRDEMARSVVIAYELPSLHESGDRPLADDAWFDPISGLLHEGG